MKKVLGIFAVVSLVTFASCNKKAQTEEVSTTDSTEVSADTTAVSVDSTTTATDSTTVEVK